MASLVHLTTYYPEVIQRLYKARPDLVSGTFANQQNALLELRFAWSDVWKHALAAFGYQVEEIILNAKHLQLAWANEHGIKSEESSWLFDVARSQITQLKPEYIFLDDFTVFSFAQLKILKESAPGATLFGWCGVPFARVDIFRGYDFILSNIPDIVNQLRQAGHSAFALRHAFDRRLTSELHLRNVQLPQLTFSGSMNTSEGWHRERMEFIDELAQSVPMSIASEYFNRLPPLTRRLCGSARPSVRWLGAVLRPSSLPLRPATIVAMQPAKYGVEMYEFLAGSTVTFNKHISASAEHATNMRLFEATGARACLVTEQTKDLATLFEPDSEVVTYTSVAECKEKVAWLLGNPQKALQIAQRGQMRTLREHTFESRAPELDAILRKNKKGA
ncbi:MAG: hypothetical protein EB101_07330 [Chitinophagia bacterium]|nr:hypothetical protein [Chitinophagia bacterium]